MRYSFVREVGRGSFGTVYEVRDPEGNRYAAKTTRTGDVLERELLMEQFAFMSGLAHRRIVRTVDFDIDDERGPVLVLEFADGVSLDAYVEANGTRGLVEITAKVLDVLRYLHTLGSLHGDLKPGGILVSGDPERPEVKLVDVGFDLSRGSHLPTLAGTLPFLAPETIRNNRGDARSDLYSLGVVLYRVLTGTNPFEGRTNGEILRKHLEHVPPVPTSLNAGIAPGWDEFIMNLIRKEPVLRYRDASHAGIELERIFGLPGVFTGNLLLPDEPPLVGRDAELRQVADSCLPPNTAPMLVVGERGCGLTRFLRVVGDRAKVGGSRVHGITLVPGAPAFATIVEALLGTTRPKDRVPASGFDPSEEALADLRALLADGKHHLLVLDGGEVIDRKGAELLAETAREVGRMAVLVGCQASAELAPAAFPGYGRVELGPLDRETVEEMLVLQLGVRAVPGDLIDEIFRTCRGNPSYTGLALRNLWAAGGIKVQPSDGTLRVDWTRTVSIPGSLRSTMLDWISGVRGTALEALKAISLGGGCLSKDVLARTLAQGEADEAVRRLAGLGLVDYSSDRESVHLKLHGLADVVLENVGPDEIKALSLRMAGAMEGHVEQGRDYYGLGHLYRRAGQAGRAAPHFVAAGDQFAQMSPSDAVLAYDAALGCESSPATVAEVHEKIGDLQLARANFAEARAHFSLAEEVRPSAKRKLGWVASLTGEWEEADRVLTEARRVAEERGDRVEEAMALSDLGYVYASRSRIEEGLECLTKARGFFERSGMAAEAGTAANRMGIAEGQSGNFKAAAAAWKDARSHFERAGDRRQAAAALMNYGVACRRQLDYAAAEESLRTALAVFEETRATETKGRCCQNCALLAFDKGNLAEARRLAEEALGINISLKRTPGVITSRLLVALVALESGGWKEAVGMLTSSSLGDESLDPFNRAIVKRYLAQAAAVAGDCARALALAEESHDLAARARDNEGQAQALVTESRVLLRLERYDEALCLAKRAATVFSLGGSLLWATVADATIGEALCLGGDIESGIARLESARANLEGLPESLHVGRIARALGRAYHNGGSQDSSDRCFGLAVDIFRKAGARYDYAATLLESGRVALAEGRFIQARHSLAEAERILKALDIEHLHREVVEEMERMRTCDAEVKAVESLSKISETLNSSHDLTTVMNLAMDFAIEYLGAERGVLMLEDESGGEPTSFVERKMDKESLREVLGISRTIVDSVRSTREPVIARDATRDPRFMNSESVRIHNVMSVMCVPLVRAGKLLGIIYLDNRGVPSDFSNLEMAFVGAFANQVALAIENARVVGRLYDDFADLKARAREKYNFASIVGPGREMQEVFRQVEKAAKSTITVLLTGESGTGKELIADLLHELSPRRDKPLVKVNCAAIQKDLLETELFGIEKHVATGIAPRAGFFERANGGTVFLDEVGDMPPATQTRVLRVLAVREFERVGGTKTTKVDVRVISATNQDVKKLLRDGRLRTDLFYRLNAMRIHLPPLRERMQDLPYLADHFIGKYGAENLKHPMRISQEALDVLKRYSWPGNVRELEKCIEHAVVVADSDLISAEHLPQEILDAVSPRRVETSTSGQSLPERVGGFERTCIIEALREAHGVKTIAADLLGIHESTLRKKVKMLGIDESHI